ncbi:MAG: hypothetical protein IPM81_06140 [Saprospirales bacterium]|nr:hypothetical protein [Saprospirales bacterium]
MKHPELLLLPVFMLADYFLTLAGAIQAEKKYSHHFQTEQYELNPAWQPRLGPRHLLITICPFRHLAQQGLSL